MIYIDDKGHVISDESEDELHSFAFKVGLKREQFVKGRLPRYNCSSVEQASHMMVMGARFVSSREIVHKLRVLRKHSLELKDIDENGVRIYKI